LKNEEKQKSHFLLFGLKKARRDFFNNLLVPNPGKRDATHPLQGRAACACTNAGFHRQKAKDAIEILTHRTRC
jgi:hypothetical protein